MRKWRRKVIGKTFIILLLLLLFIFLIVWDNNRIIVVEEEIELPHLPDEFAGFRILQITDLHEKTFGNKQERLLNVIESLDYDAIIFTGDMLNERKSTNYEPFFSLLEGIRDKTFAYYVPGNADPPSYRYVPTFSKTEYIEGIEARGVMFLESSATIERNGKKLHFVNFELAIIDNPDYIGRVNGSFQATQPFHPEYRLYQQKLWQQMLQDDIFSASDTLIALNHFPIPDERIDFIKADPHTIWRPFDFIIAGHYHGGQIRLPLIGAIFIPDPWYEPNSFFPPRNRVKGLWDYNGIKQYVSAGLGTSDAIPLLKFRLFNPPEINLLTLQRKE